MATNWYNADGLLVKFGPNEGVSGKVGEYDFDGPDHYVEATIGFGDIATADAPIDYNIVIPKGAFIHSVAISVTTAFTGSSSTLNVGGYKTDNSAVDATGGFITGLALASINAAGDYILFTTGVTAAGTYIGTVLAANVWVSTKWGTAAFTAGKATVRINYRFTT